MSSTKNTTGNRLSHLLQAYLAPNGIALFSEPNRKNAIGFFKLLNENDFTYQKSTPILLSWTEELTKFLSTPSAV